jgi:prepilin-type N-terminal cleavage/methylation domain-containing protein
MIQHFLLKKQAFTLIELVVVVVILGILTAIIIPVIFGIIETAQQATDNANARLIYNATAIWFSENSMAKSDLTPHDLSKYLGLIAFPPAKSNAFGGTFTASVTLSGSVTISTSKPATFDPEKGKLVR